MIKFPWFNVQSDSSTTMQNREAPVQGMKEPGGDRAPHASLGHHWSFICAILFLSAFSCSAREWKDAASGRTVEAELLGIEAEHAIVLLDNRKRLKLPLEKLSAPDRQFLYNWTLDKSPGEILPPP